MAGEFKKSMSQKLRMDGRDYARPGWYFITLGADYHQHYFGRIEGCEMKPNVLGRLVERCWREIPQHYGHIELGAWQLMPNHFHGLIRIVRPDGKGLGEVINMFKGSVTREWRRMLGTYGVSRHGGSEQGYSGKENGHGGKEQCRAGADRIGKPGCGEKVWAPNYYDVICFNAEELAVRENYVRANPRRWALRNVPHGRFGDGFFRGYTAVLELKVPRRFLRVSRRASVTEIGRLQRELSGFSGMVFSTFCSPGERACLEPLLSGAARLVRVFPTGLPGFIPGLWTAAFLERRALWVSSFSQEMTEFTRAGCDAANRLAEELCRRDRK